MPIHLLTFSSTQTSNARFQINNTLLYVPIVTLSINDDIEFLENMKQQFKVTIPWSWYRSEITTKAKNSNLGYIIDPRFRKINRLFFHSKMVTVILQEICLISITCHK